jgi:hypothetical protein
MVIRHAHIATKQPRSRMLLTLSLCAGAPRLLGRREEKEIHMT